MQLYDYTILAIPIAGIQHFTMADAPSTSTATSSQQSPASPPSPKLERATDDDTLPNDDDEWEETVFAVQLTGIFDARAVSSVQPFSWQPE